ncbi:hypothetical protein BDN70DRAFT_29995 [Pholiota conissans]|uniref:Uncharacterized protein n=1 Tax=Pholiota conissans TaxID=109636 RepID=A0A9P6CZA2_9AGAR|nr:hypothetical protein BDN70DRAFT_29995 [Pholiota conissans]
MRKLVLIIGPRGPLEPGGFSRMNEMLQLSVNLRDLRVLSHNACVRSTATGGKRCNDWQLGSYTFKLSTFVNSYFNPQDLAIFLEAQPMIKTLMITNSARQIIQLKACPGLENLSCSYKELMKLPPALKGKLKRLQVIMPEFMHIWDDVLGHVRSLFQETLKYLSVDVNPACKCGGYNIRRIIRKVAVFLPDIRFLEIIGNAAQGTMYSTAQPHQPESNFTDLNTLIVHPSVFRLHSAGFYLVMTEWIVLKKDEKRFPMARKIMGSIPTLKHLILTEENMGYGFKRTEGDDVEEEIRAWTPIGLPLDSLIASDAFDAAEWLHAVI